jgi:DNA-binding MarR family transcriptional regulator
LEPAGSAAVHPSEVSVAALMAHPRFMEAAQLYVRLNLSARVGEATIAKTFSEPTWHILFCMIAKVSAQSEFAQDAPLLTPSYLKSEMAMLGFSSQGKIDTAIKRMIDLGWLERASAQEDRRAVVLKPTPALLAVDDDLAAVYAQPSALLVDDDWVARIAAGDRSATRGMRAVGKSVVEESFLIIQRNARMLPMLLPNGGWLILFALLDAIWRGDNPDRLFSRIARKCNVSSPHVKSVLLTGRDHGLLEEAAPGLFAPTAEMQHLTLVWIADCLAVSIACARLAAQASSGYVKSPRPI